MLDNPKFIGLLAFVAALIATVSSAEPTGLSAWDFVLKACFAALVVLAGARASDAALLISCALVLAFSGATTTTVVAVAALALISGRIAFRLQHVVLSAAAAAVLTVAILRLPPVGFFGLPSLVAGAASLVLLASAWRRSSKVVRARSLAAAAVVFIATTVVLAVGGATLLTARSDVADGTAAARRGVQAARSGDSTRVAAQLEDAQTSLRAAESTISSGPAQLLRLVPIASQHQRSVLAASRQGVIIAEAAVEIVNSDLESIQLRAGAVDLSVFEDLAPELQNTADTLEASADALAAARSPWLLPVVADRVEDLEKEIIDVLPDARLAAQAARVMPGLLGANEPRTYFVMLGSPAESRELGGFLGSWVLLQADEGRLTIGESGRISDLFDEAAASTLDPGSVPDWYLEMGRPQLFPQNLTASPDMSVVANATNQVLGTSFDANIDGYIYVDPWVFVDALELTGPVDTPFMSEPLTQANAEQFFFEDQYRPGTDGRTELFDGLASTGGAVLSQLTSGALPGPERLGQVLGPSARAGRLQIITMDEAENDFLRAVRLLREFGPSDPAHEFLAVVQSNALSNKMDLYLDRTLRHEARIDNDGRLTATTTLTLQSNVPADAPEFTLGVSEANRSRNRVFLSLYTSGQLMNLTVDGQPFNATATTEFGVRRYFAEVLVEPNTSPTEVVWQTRGTTSPADPYVVEIWHQPLVTTDTLSVVIDAPKNQESIETPFLETIIVGSDDAATND